MIPIDPQGNGRVDALDPPGEAWSPVGTPAVVAAGVAARAAGRLLFGDLDATVTAGQLVALLGPNGAGAGLIVWLSPRGSGHRERHSATVGAVQARNLTQE